MKANIIRILGALAAAAICYQVAMLNSVARVIIGIAAALLSLTLLLISRKQLGKSFSVMPQAKPLVTTGIYSKIQHPLYLFLDLTLLGVIMIIGLPILLVIWGILVIMQFIQAGREQKLLSQSFGSDYDNYARSTWF